MTQLAPPAASAVPQPREPKARDPFFDNAKYLAILLVVGGHAIEGMRNDVGLARAVYLFFYMFHMPLFIVITGYFSRNFTLSGGKARKLITNLGVPYVVFEVAYSVFDSVIGDNPLRITMLDPYYLTWFLLALFMWRLSTPVWQQIRWPIAVAVVISLVSYTMQMSGQLDMHRVLGLLPFYVLGLMLKPSHFELLRTQRARIAGFAVLALGFGFALFAKDHMNLEWIYWRSAHSSMHVSWYVGTAMRLAMMVAAMSLVAAFLATTPRGRHWFSTLGTTTIYAYLLHGFFTKFIHFMEWDEIGWVQTPGGTVLLVVAAFALGTALCTPPVVKAFHWAVEPRMGWAFTPLRRPAK